MKKNRFEYPDLVVPRRKSIVRGAVFVVACIILSIALLVILEAL